MILLFIKAGNKFGGGAPKLSANMGVENTCHIHEITQEAIQDHEGRIRLLELKGAIQDGKIELLCEKLDSLTNQIKTWMDFINKVFWKGLGVFGALLLTLLGFLIWYIQSLPR